MEHKQATDWPKIRRAYEAGETSVRALCQKFGVGTGALYRRVKKEGWEPRRPKGPSPCHLSASGETLLDFGGMIERARMLIGRSIEAGGISSVSELERQVRIVKSLVATAKMVEQMDQAGSTDKTDKENSAVDIPGRDPVRGKLDDDADAIRRDLARRLEELLESGDD